MESVGLQLHSQDSEGHYVKCNKPGTEKQTQRSCWVCQNWKPNLRDRERWSLEAGKDGGKRRGREWLGTQAIMGKRTKSGVFQLSRETIVTGRWQITAKEELEDSRHTHSHHYMSHVLNNPTVAPEVCTMAKTGTASSLLWGISWPLSAVIHVATGSHHLR